MSKFWVLDEPSDSETAARHATRSEDTIQYEIIECPIYPTEHRRAGARLSPVNVILPDPEPYDFVWGTWACLVQQPVLNFFREAKFRGYETAPALVKFASAARKVPTFWELKASGFAGRPSKGSGSRILSVCPGCGLTVYSRIEDPTKLVDESRWDGSDFFRVEPFLFRIFITDGVAQALRESPFKGWSVRSLQEMKEDFDIAIPDLSPTERSALN